MRRHGLLLSCTIIGAVVLTAFFCVSIINGKTRSSACEDVEAVDSTGLNRRIDNGSFDAIAGIDSRMKAYMARWELKGAALAVTRNDSLVYAKGYGIADEGEAMQPGTVMRIASVSKLITAVAVMKLCEDGLMSLQDTVFGDRGILDDQLYREAVAGREAFGKITVEHLLRHQGGFYRDPMFGMQVLMQECGLDRPLDHDQTVRLGLRGRLRFEPGTWQRYSNFGYLLLSDIVAKVSGMPYEDYVREKVLAPAGCRDMRIGPNWYEDKLPGEARQYTHEGEGKYIPDIRDTLRQTERSYGGNDIELLSGAGGWVASVLELARLVACIDGDPAVPDILSAESVARMTEPTDEQRYALGWNDTRPDKGWSRTGTLSGTTAMVRRYPDGECWVFLSNTSTYKGPGQASYTENLLKQMREQCSGTLPHIDMF